MNSFTTGTIESDSAASYICRDEYSKLEKGFSGNSSSSSSNISSGGGGGGGVKRRSSKSPSQEYSDNLTMLSSVQIGKLLSLLLLFSF